MRRIWLNCSFFIEIDSLVPTGNPTVFQDGTFSVVSVGPASPRSILNISCTVVDCCSYEWTWEYNGIEIETDGRYKQIVVDATTTSILQISNLRYADNGNYTCRVRREGLPTFHKKVIQIDLRGEQTVRDAVRYMCL